MEKIIQGDCLEVLKTLKENSVDSIVTDPPYHLVSIVKRFGKEGSAPAKQGKDGSFKRLSGGFMGKTWDGVDENGIGISQRVELWLECLRVLKPGGYLLSFSGTRTYHRMAVAIEDAGFEVRDMIEWVYGCLSEDTEILTESGYKPLHKLTQYDRIGVYDITNNIYKWERPQRYSVYKVHQDTAYRIKSDYTDQLVSRNHRCVVEREGKLVFIQADELNEVEYVPTLSEDFYSLQENSNRKLLLKKLLRKGKGLAQTVFGKWKGNKKSEERIEVRKEPSLERWSNLLEETRKLQADKICEVSEGVFTDGEKRWICNGTSFDNGSILGDMFRENPSSASYQSRPTRQQTGKSDVISIKQGTQIIRRARVTKIEYSGIIFCPTVSTGAFIARRNGQVFITGNSGFPKSHNIGKNIEKIKVGGIKNLKQIGTKKGIKVETGTHGFSYSKEYVAGKSMGGKQISGDIPVYEINNEWEGWGTALKPAHEPICMARKPLGEKTVAENVLKYGTGGINIDESRVSMSQEDKEMLDAKASNNNNGVNFDVGESKAKGTATPANTLGRFPANLIHDGSEEVKECFPETGKSTGGRIGNKGSALNMMGQDYEKGDPGFGDSGNASRFFKSIIYQAKASKSERNDGCDGMPEKRPDERTETGMGKFEEKGVAKQSNFHPTVKPIALMEYLIKMVTPKGGIVLDPFAGSGSTLVAAKNLGFNYIGIELTEEYIPIIEARLKAIKQQILL